MSYSMYSSSFSRTPVYHAVMPWLVRHVGWLLSRYAVRQASGKSGYHAQVIPRPVVRSSHTFPTLIRLRALDSD